MKPFVLLDVDGVLCDFMGPLVAEINVQLGTTFKREDVTCWDPRAALGLTNKQMDAVYTMTARAPGWCRTLEPYPGAVEGFHRLKEVANIHIVTTPFHTSDYWMKERVEWLKDHFHIPSEDITFTSRKEWISADYLVDDKVETCRKWDFANRYTFGSAILWNTPHNQSYDSNEDNKATVYRIHSWDGLIEFVR